MCSTSHTKLPDNFDSCDSVKFEAAGKCLECNIPFALFAAPGEKSFTFFANPTGKIAENSFIVAPWLSKFKDAIRIYDECNAENILSSNYRYEYIGDTYSESTDKEEYINNLKSLIKRLKGTGNKVVISRVITGSSADLDYIKLTALRFASYADTFRFLYFTPQTGAWLGTTPEILFDYDKVNSTFKTMSLAGTRNKYEEKCWDTKNVIEQNIVAKYISEILKANSIPFSISRAEDINFFPVCHICDIFNGSISPQKVVRLIDALNPTPALGGFPLNNALTEISAIERHPRKCYGGYIGVNNKSKLLLHVNLRSMNFDKKAYCIYTGGGITENSVAEQEWAETKNKSLTLLKNIEKCKN